MSDVPKPAYPADRVFIDAFGPKWHGTWNSERKWLADLEYVPASSLLAAEQRVKELEGRLE